MDKRIKTVPEEKGYTLILASSSPRRKTLLQEYGLSFRILTAPAEEISIAGDGEGTVKRNAYHKAEKVLSLLRENSPAEYEKSIVIGADTVIEASGKVLGKPSDKTHAEEMLLSLAGRTHKVITGVALLSAHREVIFAVTTFVTFHPLSLPEIRSYMEKVHVLDKAGAYAAQEHGEMIIEKMDGSMENVVGLPVQEILEELQGRW